MATTQVILTTSIRKLGGEGDIVTVRPGFARNFLIPSGQALPVNKLNMRNIENLKRKRAEREAQELALAQEFAKKLAKLSLSFTLKLGAEEKAFGSVSAHDIQVRLKEEGYELDRKQIRIEKPIKTLGKHTIMLNLHNDIQHEVVIEVISDAPAKEEKTDKAKRTDKPGKKPVKKSKDEGEEA
ncbi:MAG: 50S ribosomal protein L9 [Verrucomicrobiota bacterium]|nr:50S ribosomal protein L9 [Verrucomicrobiota bacterium]